jgi:hypothetical protein
MRLHTTNSPSNTARVFCTALASFLMCSMLSGCLVAGYGTNTGGFLFPGGLGIVFILGFVLWMLLRRR